MFRSKSMLLAWCLLSAVALGETQQGDKFFDIPQPYQKVIDTLEVKSQDFEKLISTPTLKALEFRFEEAANDRFEITGHYRDRQQGLDVYVEGQFKVDQHYTLLQLYTVKPAGPMRRLHVWAVLFKKNATTTRVHLHMDVIADLPYRRWRPLRNAIISRRGPAEMQSYIWINLRHVEQSLIRLSAPVQKTATPSARPGQSTR